MSHAACTVNVVTTAGAAGRHGVTVSAMVSVSADTPQPTLLVCIHHQSPVAAALLANGVFCVNVLREDQAHISDSFAGRSAARGGDKFACARWTTQVTGAPRVLDALVAFDCRVTASDRVGSHFVVFGSVQDIHVAGSGAPLIYANRAYGVPQRFRARAAGTPGPAGAPGGAPEGAILSLGCYQVFAPYIVPALAARMAKRHPDIALHCLEADQEQLIGALRRGDIDIALLYDFGLGEGLQLDALADLRPYVLLPDGHTLGARAAISLGDLVDEPLVLLDLAPSREYFLSLFRDQGLEPRIGWRPGSLEMVRGLVGHGLGYSLLATKPANNMTYDGRALIVRPLAGPVRTSRLVLARQASRPLGAGAAALIDHARAYFHGATHAHAHS